MVKNGTNYVLRYSYIANTINYAKYDDEFMDKNETIVLRIYNTYLSYKFTNFKINKPPVFSSAYVSCFCRNYLFFNLCTYFRTHFGNDVDKPEGGGGGEKVV